MSEISREIRVFANTYYPIGHREAYDALFSLADRIDAEMVELPRDRDGVPIRVGDTVYLDDGSKAKVTRIDIAPTESCIVCRVHSGGVAGYMPSDISHKRSDSLERIADELAEREASDADGAH